MEQRAESLWRRRLSPRAAAGLVASVSLVLAVGACWLAELDHQRRAQQQLQTEARVIETGLEERLHQYEQVAFGVRAMLAAVPSLDGRGLKDWSRERDLWRQYPGVEHVALIEERAARAGSGEPVWAYSMVESRVPGAASSLVGLDAKEDPARRDALVLANASPQPVLSRAVDLVPGSPGQGEGVLIVLRVDGDDQAGAPVRWIAVGLRVDGLVCDLPGFRADSLDCRLVDLGDGQRSTLLFDDGGDEPVAGARRATAPVVLNGRRWAVTCAPTARYTSVDGSRLLPRYVLATMLALGALATGIVWSLSSVGSRARVLAQDMTRALRESERHASRLALVAARTHNAVLITDATGRIEWVNDAFTRLTGYTPGEVRGRTPGTFLGGPATDPAHAALMRERIAKGEGFDAETINYARDGRSYWVAIEGRPVHDARGVLTNYIAVETDITHRKQAEEALAESDRFSRSVVDSLEAQIAILDENAVVVAANSAWQRSGVCGVGGCRAPLPGDSYLNALDEAGAGGSAQCADAVRDVLGGRSGHASIEYACRDGGEERWFLMRVTPFSGEGPRRIVVAHHDITELVRARDTLAERERFIQRLADTAPVVLYVFDIVEHRVVYANQRLAEVLGVSHEEFGRVRDGFQSGLLHPDDAGAMNEHRRRVRTLADGLAAEIEYRVRRADGTYAWLSGREMVLTRDASGEARQVVGAVTDITGEVQADRALRETQERYDLAVRGSNDGIWDWNVVTNEFYFSPRLIEQLGLESGAIENRLEAFESRLHPEDHERVLAALGDHLARRAAYDTEYRMRAADGSWRWFRGRGQAVWDDSGDAVRMAGSTTDITEHKRAEAELRQFADDLLDAKTQLEARAQELADKSAELEQAREAADAANQAKSEFLANMSHEIRTPMTAIVGYADLLLEPGLAPREATEYAQTIRRNGEHLLSLINDILDLSKIEAGRMTVEEVPCSPTRLVEDVISLMQVRALDKGLELKGEYAFPLPATITTDPLRLKQILVNLVANAIKFTREGSVTVRVSGGEGPGDARMRFEVVDTGVGMEPGVVARLFRPFTQADNSTTRRFGGTGLGLTISRRLAEMLDGSIGVESVLGKGSTFRLEIGAGETSDAMVTRVPPRAGAPRRADPAASLSCRILLAEDGPDNQRLICFHLRRAGASVEVVGNGRAAVNAALAAAEQGRPFGVVLMDMQMPELDGYAAASELRLRGYAGPIVALTAHAMAGDAEKCVAAGCNEHLTKPIDKDRLLETCAAWAARGAARAEERKSA